MTDLEVAKQAAKNTAYKRLQLAKNLVNVEVNGVKFSGADMPDLVAYQVSTIIDPFLFISSTGTAVKIDPQEGLDIIDAIMEEWNLLGAMYLKYVEKIDAATTIEETDVESFYGLPADVMQGVV